MANDRTERVQPNTMVRLRGDPSRFGLLKSVQMRAGRAICVVQFQSSVQRIPCDQLEPLPSEAEEPTDLLAQGRLSAPNSLRRVLAHVRIAGRLTDMIYSMEATNTDFHAYQFKPVLKMLSAPTGNLLIADEVGLGKTIEAGLIWTELKARFGYRRLLVLCPAALRDKWRTELASKFDLDARVVSAPDLLNLIEDQARTPRGFVAIGSIQGLRPPSGWDDSDSEAYERPASRLARRLEAEAEQEPLFDLVVIDEAHHLRNPGTRHHLLGRLLRPLANHRLFLSATPVHLRSRDLFSLLSLLDPDTFPHELVLDMMIEANRPLIAARDTLLRGGSRQDVLAALDDAPLHSLLHDSEQIATLRREVSELQDPIKPAERARLAERLESANLLANILNRTRRRDVKEFRVVRQVTPYFAEMTPLERRVYERVAREVDAYASKNGTVAGFLLAMPARQLASSIPAAIAHWRSEDADLASEDEENGTNGDANERNTRPLVKRLVRLSQDLPGAMELERNDTKFDEFLRVIRNYLDANPREKLVVFSTFRATLGYLARRLSAAGIAAETIDGQVKDRESVLDRFREGRESRVLLSSEVGSEGIDLQFCRAVVNYDLPWNPMRIEQRIGRIDRLGQEAQSIAVLNLLHRDTIDERIYRRLYQRLNLIEKALGDFEEVLGEEIQKLTIDLLTRTLTEEEKTARIEQAGQAIETVRRQTEALEASAAALMALGDEVLRSINAAHDNHRFIGAQDLASYLRDALGTLFPGCTVHQREETDLYDIQLTQDVRLAYADWIEGHHYPSGDRLQRDFGPIVCRLGRPDPERRRKPIETITQAHPFVQFVSAQLQESGTPGLRPAVAARLAAARSRGPFPPGRYCVLASHWRFESEIEQERIAYAGLSFPEGVPLDDGDAERLVLAATEHGTAWPEARHALDLAVAASLCSGPLLDRLAERFATEERIRQAEQTDRVQIQLRTLEGGYRRNRSQLEETVERQRMARQKESIIRANEGRIRALEERYQQRIRAIEARREVTASEEQFAALLVEVI